MRGSGELCTRILPGCCIIHPAYGCKGSPTFRPEMKHTLWVLLLLPSLAWGQVANYPFQPLFGSYTEDFGGTELGNNQNDDRAFDGLPIDFDFNYDGSTYTTFCVNTNGFLVLGSTSIATGQGVAFANNSPSGRVLASANGSNEVIAGFNMDLAAQASSVLTYQTIGTAPDRKLVVQWKDYTVYSRTPVADTINFQIILYEGSNAIEVVYGPMVYAHTNAYTAQAGLRGSSPADFNARTGTSWLSSLPAAVNTDGLTVSDTTFFLSGTGFRWTRPVSGTNLYVRSLLPPAENGCILGTLAPVAEVQNGAVTPIDTVIGYYTVNGVASAPDTILLDSTLMPGSRIRVAFHSPYNFSAVRRYNVMVSLTGIHDDAGSHQDDTASAVFVSAAPVQGLPFTETFVSTTTLSNRWSTRVLRGQGNWSIAGPQIALGQAQGPNAVNLPTVTGAGAAFYNSYNSRYAGGLARLLSPCLDVAGAVSDSLMLEVSYLQSNAYLDRMDSIQVLVSTDNGYSFTPLTTLYRPTADVPTNQGQWALAVIPLDAYRTQSSLRFAFDAGGADGNNCAIDYLRLRTASVTAVQPSVTLQPTLHPNPAHGTVSLRSLPEKLQGTQAPLLDACGRTFRTLTLQGELSLEGIAPGVYTLPVAGKHIRLVVE